MAEEQKNESESEAIEGEIVDALTSVGRTKHPEEIVQLLENAFHSDFNITEACQYAGIARDTYYNWMADDDIFSYRMSVAQAKPLKDAKKIVQAAIRSGDAKLALKYLSLRDPDFRPKVGLEAGDETKLSTTREKIKDFLDDKGTDVSSEQSIVSSTDGTRETVEEPPQYIS